MMFKVCHFKYISHSLLIVILFLILAQCSSNNPKQKENYSDTSEIRTIITENQDTLYEMIDKLTGVKFYNFKTGLNLGKETRPSSRKEFAFAAKEIIKGLRKYPDILVKSTLRRVIIYESLYMNEIYYAGTFYFTYNKDENEVYCTFRDGIEYIESVFHHEYHSLLMKIYGYNVFREKEWLSLNKPDFQYWDPKRGIDYIKKYKTSQPSFDTTFLADGFLSRYSMSSMDNDMSRYAENLFIGRKALWDAYEKYPIVKQKVDLIIEIYHKIHPFFTKKYFLSLCKDCPLEVEVAEKKH